MAKLKMVAPNVSPKYANLSHDEYKLLSHAERQNYVFDNKTNTYKMDEFIWKEIRQHWVDYNNPMSKLYVPYTVTGSEAGSIAVADAVTRELMGRDAHVFRCKSELWCEKKGVAIPLKKPKNSSEEEIYAGGHMMELVAAQALERKLNNTYPEHIWEVVMGERMYQYGERDEKGELVAPWLIATPDAFVYCDGELEGIAEFKNIQPFSPNAKVVKQGIVPAEYYTQGSHYMMATATKRVFYMIVMGNSYPDDFHMIIEERDEIFCEELYRVEKEYIVSLEDGIMPPLDGSDGQDVKQIHNLLRRMMGNYVPDAPAVKGDSSLAEVVEEISFIDSEIETLEERIKKLKEEKETLLVKHIFPAVKSSNELLVPVEGTSKNYKVVVKDEKIPKSVDEEEIKIKEPEAYKECLETKFSAALFKKKFPKLYEKYAKAGTTLTDKKRDFCKIRIA